MSYDAPTHNPTQPDRKYTFALLQKKDNKKKKRKKLKTLETTTRPDELTKSFWVKPASTIPNKG